MSIGEKVRALRRSRGLTQQAVADGCISRNMLCLIEKDKVTPSVGTLLHIAERLGVCAGYFLDGEDDLFFYEKKKKIEKIRKLFNGRKYADCLKELKTLGGSDDECAYFSAVCACEMGILALKNGSLLQAEEHLLAAERYCLATHFDTGRVRSAILLYLPVARNVQSPLLDFDEDAYRALLDEGQHSEFYHYLIQDLTYGFSDRRYADHMIAKGLIRDRRYADACLRLERIEDTLPTQPYDAFLFFSVYTDLELCHKELCHFEQAYRYANKRMSLLESFRS